MTQGQ